MLDLLRPVLKSQDGDFETTRREPGVVVYNTALTGRRDPRWGFLDDDLQFHAGFLNYAAAQQAAIHYYS
jgi:hypothetical protein|tara:strand:+ start:1131 stop:1337 length:207 start_codon:yes stop_codon:yes gene_type:complete